MPEGIQLEFSIYTEKMYTVQWNCVGYNGRN